MNGILTVEEAAALLRVRPKTVRALASGGVIPAAKLGKFWRFDETLLREWLRITANKNVTGSATRALASPKLANVTPARSLSARLDEMLAQEPTAPARSPRKRERKR